MFNYKGMTRKEEKSLKDLDMNTRNLSFSEGIMNLVNFYLDFKSV